ncbi:unnamed protein product [Rotaria magnacalcarata]|uniref:Uncharacterized protein n=1 Tax=Rotaria magnacalcarata TaxID=392030 RepID=A0A816SR56_9BILA|nr:unnamed protein product [Rotaria magnacalcarata]CAF1588195.1 unnamed protein product [Rotaria magnacalcarata]CAF2088126.1 unnamed protein product [Rotaria magnacalcarata]CAF4115983.1 unnamed protein product [Rotaria magnacalcarata]CAF4150895.1 unnamed protein product [Rotaria magnacalcarata]
MLKANKVLVISCLIFYIACAATQSNTSVIEIPSVRSRISSVGTSNQRSYFYAKSQDTTVFAVASVSATFVKVPGLSISVHHDQPMLYRIGFQGGCQSGTFSSNFVHLLIDGYVLIENELLPNNNRRQAVASHLGASIDEIDQRNGGLFYGRNLPFAASCPRFRKVILPSGTHSIDVGIRITIPSMNLIGGQLEVELSVYDPGTQIGLSYPIIR